MQRKKKNSEENSEGWMLPYSDMLTLLLALFIVMFASAKVDDRKFQEIKSEFGSIMAVDPPDKSDSGSMVVALDSPSVASKTPAGEAKDPKTKKAAQKREHTVRGTLTEQNQKQQIKEIAQSLNETARQLDMGNTKATLKSDGLHFNLDSSILFDSGSADLTGPAQQALRQLGPKLSKLRNNQVMIAGYTDNVPQKSAQYPSNWELSSARAVSVMHFFVKENALVEGNVSIRAYGENQAKASNETAQGRAQNRRVELVIKAETD
ncbi:flagellar motor protein MotB [Ligilactobacillus salitolerans]|uniref:Flagellar motor protein MotB n=1 Tax=Ligilactobacillus salitolerans TaxID=1808352 RepID=A0A401IW32_9LACO|nr:flagellar motor protein MotB [Ligilactobacillus salitolerans]GBG95715.1 flagellar motor protein MotB [Ligilactobacillus salitolerans]